MERGRGRERGRVTKHVQAVIVFIPTHIAVEMGVVNFKLYNFHYHWVIYATNVMCVCLYSFICTGYNYIVINL